LTRSFAYHTAKQAEATRNCEEPTRLELEQILNDAEDAYAPAKVQWRSPDDWVDALTVFNISRYVDMRSSPGWPWKTFHTTNAEVFGWNGVQAQEAKLRMVKVAVMSRLNELKSGEARADPIYLFIKPEMHKRKKKENGAWRLISGVGLTDTLVDRALYGSLLDSTIEQYRRVPSKGGWSPQQGGYELVQRAFVMPLAIDKSAWDWTVQAWHVDFLEQWIQRMHYGAPEWWASLLHTRLEALYADAVFKPQCGCEVRQKCVGIQKSGCLGTLAFNSVWQYAVHSLARRRAGLVDPGAFYALGDDTLQECCGWSSEQVDAYLHQLAKTGCVVKESERGWPTTFGGHVIRKEAGGQACVPAYVAKHLFELRYLREEVEAETLDSYQRLYALQPDMLGLIQALLARTRVDLVQSRARLDWWYRFGE